MLTDSKSASCIVEIEQYFGNLRNTPGSPPGGGGMNKFER
jgi:hypothetical protein